MDLKLKESSSIAELGYLRRLMGCQKDSVYDGGYREAISESVKARLNSMKDFFRNVEGMMKTVALDAAIVAGELQARCEFGDAAYLFHRLGACPKHQTGESDAILSSLVSLYLSMGDLAAAEDAQERLVLFLNAGGVGRSEALRKLVQLYRESWARLSATMGELGLEVDICLKASPLLHRCVCTGDASIVSAVIASDIDANTTDYLGRTALHIATRKSSVAVIRALIAGGASIDSVDIFGRTPLFLVAEDGDTTKAKELLGARADPAARGQGKRQALHIAVIFGHEAMVRLLLECDGIDPNQKDEFGNSPLHDAVDGRNEVVVGLLLQFDAIDPNLKDHCGSTPLHHAARGNDEAAAKLLLGCPGVNLNAKDNLGRTPLYCAVYGSHEAVVKLLLKYPGIDPNTKNESGDTPLHCAASRGHEAVVESLLGYRGTALNLKNNRGRTPLHCAANRGYEDLTKLLLGCNGVTPNSKDNDGWTPLHHAYYEGFEPVVKLLLGRCGVDPNVKDRQGYTPLDLAGGGRDFRNSSKSLVEISRPLPSHLSSL